MSSIAKPMRHIPFYRTEKFQIAFWGLLLCSFLTVTILIPFFYLFVTSLKDMGQYYSTTPQDVWFPDPLHFENFDFAWNQVPMPLYIWNSLWLATVQTVSSTFMSAVIAYGFSRFYFKFRDSLFVVLLATLMLPTEVTSIPLFMLYKQIGWTNSFLPLIVPAFFGSAWSIFLIRQMMLNLPKEIDEAARIDGCGTWKTFWHVVLPQVAPALIVSGLFTFLWSWKDFMGPLLYLKDSSLYTLSLGLLYFESPVDKQYTQQLAGVVIGLIPTLIIYAFGQRYFERGINVSELK